MQTKIKKAVEVTLDELRVLKAPPATRTWFPVSHHTVFCAAERFLRRNRFLIETVCHRVTHDQSRYFATINLQSELTTGVHLAVGLRNSTDKSLPLGFCAGSRVLVCDNLSFHSDLVVHHKHTRFGRSRFESSIESATQRLPAFASQEQGRIEVMRATILREEQADSLILHAFESDVIGARVLPLVLAHWRDPEELEQHGGPTAWTLFNAFTAALRADAQANPNRFANTTGRLYELLCHDN